MIMLARKSKIVSGYKKPTFGDIKNGCDDYSYRGWSAHCNHFGNSGYAKARPKAIASDRWFSYSRETALLAFVVTMKSLGKYEVLEEINAGGMGKICRAHDRVLHREVAIKTIYTGQTDPEIKRRFYREARACAALSHPNIVTVFELGEQQGISYIAMELLDGEDLRKFIDRKGSMPLEAKANFMIEVCDGLEHAHRHGIIHRDLKPGNIFITRSGKPKILDFGVARISVSQLTQPGTALGTPRYMAPEQFLGKDCDVRSDLFSIGMVFFEFLCGVHPFDEPGRELEFHDRMPLKEGIHEMKTRGERGSIVNTWSALPGDLIPNGDELSHVPDRVIPDRIMKEEPLSLRSVNPLFPERLDRVLSRTLAKNPDTRPQSAVDLAKELNKVSFDLVNECSRLWTETLVCRQRILELKVATAGRNASINLDLVEKINPNASATMLSELHYFDLIRQRDELRRTEASFSGLVQEPKSSGISRIRRLFGR
jgi:serine/threonine protein kinase